MNSWFKGKVFSYVLFGLAVVAVIASFLGFISEPIMLSVAGVLGFGGLASLRAFIDSTGYKSYISAGFGVLGVIGQMLFPTLVTPEVLTSWLALWGTIAGVTMTQAVNKAQNSK